MSAKKSIQETTPGRAVVQQLRKDLVRPMPGGGTDAALYGISGRDI